MPRTNIAKAKPSSRVRPYRKNTQTNHSLKHNRLGTVVPLRKPEYSDEDPFVSSDEDTAPVSPDKSKNTSMLERQPSAAIKAFFATLEGEIQKELMMRSAARPWCDGGMTRAEARDMVRSRANAVDTKSILPLRGKAALALWHSSSSRDGPGRSAATTRPNQPSSQAHDLLNRMDLDVDPPEHLSISHPSHDEDHLASLRLLQEPLAHAPVFTDEYEAICNRYYEALGDPASGCASDSRSLTIIK
ncbi:hypothetical protein JB92DRAFT_3125327 [Gautieria morchelliformis]|nr:hypothetical protein JB92DRAFT_3125327 [Gautieria morchelliformis]